MVVSTSVREVLPTLPRGWLPILRSGDCSVLSIGVITHCSGATESCYVSCAVTFETAGLSSRRGVLSSRWGSVVSVLSWRPLSGRGCLSFAAAVSVEA
jgi:hypothetical protein